ncbi:MAG: hypothetical protein J0L75_11950 [Spirochaetes bacterium]|nr:hypothetical protein [Spirochaetota bacterium]
MPLHPFLVHLPLGLALALPVALLAYLIRGRLRRQSQGRSGWFVVLLLQAVLFASVLLSNRTGNADGRRAGVALAAAPLDEHEDAANLFTVSAAVTLLAAMAGAFTTRSRAAFLWLTLGLSVFQGALAFRAGFLGTELIYRHGAAGHGETLFKPAAGPRP